MQIGLNKLSLQSQLLFCSIILQLISGLLANDPSSPKDANKAASHKASSSSSSSTVSKLIIVCLGVITFTAFAALLFKIWQKKMREEQQARLLKLFEDDDELEIELGIRED